MTTNNRSRLERTTGTNPEIRVNSGSVGDGGAIRSYEETFDYPYCDNVDEKYQKLERIGKGTFGEVFWAKNKKTNKEVALKRILMEAEKEGFPITAIREIKILKLAEQVGILENVVRLYEVCRSTEFVDGKAISYLAFEFCHHDLAGLIQEEFARISPLPFVKCIMKQLLAGIYALHCKKIIHRDMKSSNILITKHGDLKIADFGLARPYTIPDRQNKEVNKYTNRVVTLWYRPPELLLGERDYECAVDMWGAGCIMAELFTRAPLMRGSTEQAQLQLIIEHVGPINPSVWPDVTKFDLYKKISKTLNSPKSKVPRLTKICADQTAQDLLKRLLCLDPAKRIKNSEACDHDFFWEPPMTADKKDLAQQLANVKSHFEYTSKKKIQNNQFIHAPPQMVHRNNNYHRPINHRPGPSANNDGQYRDHVY